jgi:hypothetical protein
VICEDTLGAAATGRVIDDIRIERSTVEDIEEETRS